MRARGRAFHYCLENYLLMLTTEAYVLMKVSWSLLLLALVTVSPVLAADDEIWGSSDERKEQTESTKADVASTEEDVVDPMPSPVDAAPESAEVEEDDAD